MNAHFPHIPSRDGKQGARPKEEETVCVSSLPAERRTSDAPPGGAVLASPALDPELPAVGLPSSSQRGSKGLTVPISPRIKAAQGSSQAPSNIGFHVFCNGVRQGGGWAGLGRAFRRTAATCKVRESRGETRLSGQKRTAPPFCGPPGATAEPSGPQAAPL